MRIDLKFTLTLLTFSIISTVVTAQQLPGQQQEVKEDYNKNELELFIDANAEVAEVQMNNEQKMIDAIEEEGLDVNKFNQILTANQNPNQEPNATEEELQQFNQATQKVMRIQQNMQGEVQKAIEKTGMTVEKYDQILLAYQNSQKVQQDVNQLLQERQQADQ